MLIISFPILISSGLFFLYPTKVKKLKLTLSKFFVRDVRTLFFLTSLDALKWDVPAAPSGTATLLRLSPSYLFYPRQLLLRSPTSGTPNFHGLTGGVYKARERIHRAMADARLLAIPAS